MSWKKNLTVATILAGTTTLGIHMINKAIHLSATFDNLLGNSSENYYDWKFGRIFYKKKGTGKPVLLIHDLTTFSSADEWNEIINSLSSSRTVYAIDLLGCGRSDKPNLTYTNFMYVQMISDFIKNVIGDKTDVIVTGNSVSYILGSCHNESKLYDNLILINPADISELARIPSKRSKILTKLVLTPFIGTLLYNILVRKNVVERLFKEKYFFDKSKIQNSYIQTCYESAHRGNAESKYLFASICGNYLTANAGLYLQGLDNSIFILSGSTEKEREIAEEYKRTLPSIETVSINDVKHLPQLENPSALLEHVNVFLNIC